MANWKTIDDIADKIGTWILWIIVVIVLAAIVIYSNVQYDKQVIKEALKEVEYGN